MADQFRFDAIRAPGSPDTYTLNIDRLATWGVAFTTYPVIQNPELRDCARPGYDLFHTCGARAMWSSGYKSSCVGDSSKLTRPWRNFAAKTPSITR